MLSNSPQEYETMSTESSVPPRSTSSSTLQGDDTSMAFCHKVKALPSSTLVVLSHAETPQAENHISAVRRNHEACEGDVAKQRDLVESPQLTGAFTSEIKGMDDQTEVGQGIGRYEYMDIRRSDSSEGGDPELQRSGSHSSAAETRDTDKTVAVSTKEQKGRETENHHNTDKPTCLQGILSSMPEPDVLASGAGEVEEYEEMTGLGEGLDGWGHAEYENLPEKEWASPEEVGGVRCAGIEKYIKVCAGIGEPGSSTSFDNPDYWHSRMFLKPDAVRT